MRTTTLSSLACAVVAAAISMGSTEALAPRAAPAQQQLPADTLLVSRRSAALAVLGSAVAVATAAPGAALAKEELTPEEKQYLEKQKEKMRQKIEASKKNYRKTNDLVEMRKKTVDYSCLDKECTNESGEVQKKENFVTGLLSGAP